MKFIFTLRNPIERTWANYRYTVLQGLEDLSFEEALHNEKQRIEEQNGIWAEIQPHNYTGRGQYSKKIREYIKYFPKENFYSLSQSLYQVKQTRSYLKYINFLA